MTTYKGKRRGRKTVRGHRQSTSGKIFPPLDVRSNNMMGEFTKRILAGPITIIMVYADWCGHCHHMMPHFKEAAKSSNRSVQAIMLNDTMLNKANSSINSSINQSAKPIKVDGYPSILLVDSLGNKVTEINAVKNTETMTKVMNESGSLAKNAGIASVNRPSINRMSMNRPSMNRPSVNRMSMNRPSMNQPSVNRMSVNSMSVNRKSVNRPMLSMVERNEPAKEFVENISENEVISPAKNIESMEYTSIKPISVPKEPNFRQAVGIEETGMASRDPMQSLGDVDTFSAVREQQEEPRPTLPPIGNDLHSISNELSENKKIGGSLYEAMSRSAYVLAPAAALLATSALVMKRGRTRRNKRSKRTKRNK